MREQNFKNKKCTDELKNKISNLNDQISDLKQRNSTLENSLAVKSDNLSQTQI